MVDGVGYVTCTYKCTGLIVCCTAPEEIQAYGFTSIQAAEPERGACFPVYKARSQGLRLSQADREGDVALPSIIGIQPTE